MDVAEEEFKPTSSAVVAAAPALLPVKEAVQEPRNIKVKDCKEIVFCHYEVIHS